MFCEHFGLKENPFSISPDPRYLYLSDAHREAMAHLLFALRGEGCFVLLTGEVGTGKTMVCRCLLEQLPGEVQVALVLNPRLDVHELLATICDELGIAYPEGANGSKAFVDRLNSFLLDAHGRGLTTVLIIDEAQNLSADVLEQLRLLTNLETNNRKLLQIILIGQPELRTLLQRDDLRQLAQRITARYHLGPLQRRDLAPYLAHRLAVAGVRRPLFSRAAMRRLYRLSGGIPRLINTLGDRALLGAYARGRHVANAFLISAAARELAAPARRSERWLPAIKILVVTMLLLGLGWQFESRPWPEFQPTLPSEQVANQPPAISGEPAAASPVEGLPVADDAWFDGIDPSLGNRNEAWTVLLHLWGDPLTQPSPACNPPAGSGFACFDSSATLATLLTLDRPAILQLHRPDGAVFYGVLTAVKGDRVVLSLGDRVGLLPASRLEEMWRGDFSLLWQPPEAIDGVVGPGSKGDEVAWLAKALNVAGVAGAEQGIPRKFGPALADRIKQFQVRSGVQPDGIAGPQTLILLTNALAAPGPRLSDRFTEQ